MSDLGKKDPDGCIITVSFSFVVLLVVGTLLYEVGKFVAVWRFAFGG